ncbi:MULTISPECIES: sugar transferase [Paenibacillus]|uniref:sugar transferase n=1 Tax=Paenibacillus TaxID=44249 RepID=UPI000784AA53|nr:MULTISPECIES: sugar transferase [Paenibacillus]
MKRLIDIVLSLLASLIFLPIFIIIAILIKLDSKGPIFFKQKRAGKNGSLFYIYKFRSMKVDTPNLATDKLNNPEEYITNLGKFIRKTSLDELPQLINILKGDMSIVGPRPALYNQYELIEARHQKGINCIRPGLTGYAQIMGRDFISDDQKVEYDKYYLDHMSLLLDLKILFLTFSKVIKAENVRG